MAISRQYEILPPDNGCSSIEAQLSRRCKSDVTCWQRILIPPYGGSNPPRSAKQSGICPSSQRNAGIARKSGQFAYLIPSLDSRFAGLGVKIAENLRQGARIFPFWRDNRQRPVRSGLPPEVNDLKQAVSGRQHMPNIDAFTRARHHSRRITPVWRVPRRTGPRSWLGSTEKSVVPSATSRHR